MAGVYLGGGKGEMSAGIDSGLEETNVLTYHDLGRSLVGLLELSGCNRSEV